MKMQKNYNYIEMIRLYYLCTGNSDIEDIMRIMSKSETHDEIKNENNEAYLYEGFISNLLDVVDDLKQVPDYPEELNLVTPETITAVMRTRRYYYQKQTSIIRRMKNIIKRKPMLEQEVFDKKLNALVN